MGGIQCNAGTSEAFLAESLPTSMRYTGSALGMTFGAPIPFIAAWIFQNTENGTVALTTIALSIVALSMIATLTLPERFKQQLHEVNWLVRVQRINSRSYWRWPGTADNGSRP